MLSQFKTELKQELQKLALVEVDSQDKDQSYTTSLARKSVPNTSILQAKFTASHSAIRLEFVTSRELAQKPLEHQVRTNFEQLVKEFNARQSKSATPGYDRVRNTQNTCRAGEQNCQPLRRR